MRFLQTLLLGCAGAAAMLSSAAAATLVPVPDVPNSRKTTVFAINDNNVIAGSYLGKDHVEHAFFGPLGSYTTFDAGPGGTEARGINNSGVIAGASNAQNGITSEEIAFIRKSDGRIVTVSGIKGRAQGINNSNEFAGTYWDFTDFDAVAFIGDHLQYKRDVSLPVQLQASEGTGRNDYGYVVGSFFAPPERGFIRGAHVMYVVDFPSRRSTGTQLEGVNNLSQVVGNWFDDKGHPHAFQMEIATGRVTDIEVPGAKRVHTWGINNNGAVAVSTNIGSFIWCELDGACPAGGTPVKAAVHFAPKPVPQLLK
jgi:opacity protein-like surface antigen